MHIGFQIGHDLHLHEVRQRSIAISGADSAAAHRDLKAVRELDPALDLKDVYGFFDLVNPGGGRPLLSEDLSFCHRWTTACRGRIWCKIDHEIGHVGPFLFSATPAAGILRREEPDAAR
jgi:hypothetical protein